MHVMLWTSLSVIIYALVGVGLLLHRALLWLRHGGPARRSARPRVAPRPLPGTRAARRARQRMGTTRRAVVPLAQEVQPEPVPQATLQAVERPVAPATDVRSAAEPDGQPELRMADLVEMVRHPMPQVPPRRRDPRREPGRHPAAGLPTAPRVHGAAPVRAHAAAPVRPHAADAPSRGLRRHERATVERADA